MHDIKKKKKQTTYEGLKGKLIHLDPKTLKFLSKTAKIKQMNLKSYIEELCYKQAIHEANLALEQLKKSKNT